MTDPVDTDALRETALDLEPVRADERISNTQWARVHIAKRALSTAADEVDRLREQLAAAEDNALTHARDAGRFETEADRLRAELDAWEPAWRHMREERDEARAAVENAPHDSGCQFSFLPEDKPRRCTCWKADAR